MPNSFIFTPIIRHCKSFGEARTFFDLSPASARNTFLFNALLSKLPLDDFDGAKAAWTEMKTLEPPVAPDPYTCAEIAKRAPTIEAGLAILDELIARGGEPNSYAYEPILHRPGFFQETYCVIERLAGSGETITLEMSSVLGSRAANLDHMDKARELLLRHKMAGFAFYCSVYKACACRIMDGETLLAWAFAKGKTSFDAFQTAINHYAKQGKLYDALRIASAFPHLPKCRGLFKRFPDATEAYLTGRFEAGLEPANASTALGYFFKLMDRRDDSIDWFERALEQPDASEAKKNHIRKELRDLRGS